jgi:4-diphosphocytidyl-2-C-methyl-D-erythritol kinase
MRRQPTVPAQCERTVKKTEFAPAKINLYLRVTGRRADGYHELDSVFVPVSVCDRVRLEIRPAAPPAVALRCDSAVLPSDSRNLAVRAALAFMAEFGMNAEVMIHLHKEIPIGAGLGGGSSDAGAVLRMMAALGGVTDHARLTAVALTLGADVPFFLAPAPARVGGIGERITPLQGFPPFALLIAVPPVQVPTAAVFRDLVPGQWSGPASDADVRAILEGRITPEIAVNDLAKVAMVKWPVIAELKTAMENAGAGAAAMTGSGSGVFGIFATSSAATHAAAELQRVAPATRIFTATPWQKLNMPNSANC